MPLRPQILSLLPFLLIAGGCALAPAQPRETGPDAFVIERDLAGETVARGEFTAITGLKRGFTARLRGVRTGDTFTLKESFAYDDGETDAKTWVLTLKGDGAYSGTREDVVGVARGWQDGRAFRLAYDIRLPDAKGRPGMKLHFQDVMVKTADGVVLNNATVGKWGFGVAKVRLKITPAG